MASSLRACCKCWQSGFRGAIHRSGQPVSRQQNSRRVVLPSRVRTQCIVSRGHFRPFQTCTSLLRTRRDAPSEPPPTDFNELNMLGDMPTPSTSVDVCMYDGFGLNSGLTITGGDGALLVNGEAFVWRPWEANESKHLLNSNGQFELPNEALGVFDLLWPRPGMFLLSLLHNNLIALWCRGLIVAGLEIPYLCNIASIRSFNGTSLGFHLLTD